MGFQFFELFNYFVCQQKQKKSPIEILEEGLAKARAAIRSASRFRRSTSNRSTSESYVPKGSVYRNPYAFHQLRIFFNVKLYCGSNLLVSLLRIFFFIFKHMIRSLMGRLGSQKGILMVVTMVFSTLHK